jgi:hypothetical protein
MLEKKELKSMGKTLNWFEDEAGQKYRRITCGLSFPFGNRPGFVVVLGEDLHADHTLELAPRHIRHLAEFANTEVEPLHRKCLEFQDGFHVTKIYGNPEKPLYAMWRTFNSQAGSVDIASDSDIVSDSEKLDLDLILQLVKKNTAVGRKALHFGQSKLPGQLSSLVTGDLSVSEIDEYPEVAAFGRALAAIELLPFYSGAIFTPKRRIRLRSDYYRRRAF